MYGFPRQHVYTEQHAQDIMFGLVRYINFYLTEKNDHPLWVVISF